MQISRNLSPRLSRGARLLGIHLTLRRSSLGAIMRVIGRTTTIVLALLTFLSFAASADQSYVVGVLNTTQQGCPGGYTEFFEWDDHNGTIYHLCSTSAPLQNDPIIQGIETGLNAVRQDVIAQLDKIAASGTSNVALEQRIATLEQQVRDLQRAGTLSQHARTQKKSSTQQK
jgi:hypothetical protein